MAFNSWNWIGLCQNLVKVSRRFSDESAVKRKFKLVLFGYFVKLMRVLL